MNKKHGWAARILLRLEPNHASWIPHLNFHRYNGVSFSASWWIFKLNVEIYGMWWVDDE